MPPLTETTSTPNELHKIRLITKALMEKTTRLGKLIVRQLANTYDKAHSVNRILFTELKGHRKRGLDDEESTTVKRLKK